MAQKFTVCATISPVKQKPTTPTSKKPEAEAPAKASLADLVWIGLSSGDLAGAARECGFPAVAAAAVELEKSVRGAIAEAVQNGAPLEELSGVMTGASAAPAAIPGVESTDPADVHNPIQSSVVPPKSGAAGPAVAAPAVPPIPLAKLREQAKQARRGGGMRLVPGISSAEGGEGVVPVGLKAGVQSEHMPPAQPSE